MEKRFDIVDRHLNNKLKVNEKKYLRDILKVYNLEKINNKNDIRNVREKIFQSILLLVWIDITYILFFLHNCPLNFEFFCQNILKSSN